MTILEHVRPVPCDDRSQLAPMNQWVLEQMAEALEDQASGLARRAAGFEEEECLLNNEIADRQTEINRLLLKLEAIRSERDALLERIESLNNEASGMRNELFAREEESVLSALERAPGPRGLSDSSGVDHSFRAPITRPLNAL